MTAAPSDHGLTPFQTAGPFFHLGMCREDLSRLAREQTDGRRILITGTVRDGDGLPVSDALVEIWQADGSGHYSHPADREVETTDLSFSGFGRAPTDDAGCYSIETIMPGPVDGPNDIKQAPHILVGLLARGVLTRLVTRIYFEDDPSISRDVILALVPADRRSTLLARRASADVYRFDITLQGERETVFFDV